jgi:hypothetical protein
MSGNTSRLVAALLVLFLLALPALALAQAPAGQRELSPEAQQIHDNLFDAKWREHQAEQGLLSRAIARVASEMVASIVWGLGLQDHVTLIFGVEPRQTITSRSYIPPENLVLYTFTQDQAGVIGMFYDAFGRLIWIMLIIAVLIAGYLVFLRSMSADGVRTAKDYLLGLVIFLGLMLFGGVLVEPLFFLNRAFVLFIGSQVGPALEAPIFEALFNNAMFVAAHPLVLGAIVLVMAIFLGLFNFQYMMRTVSLAILLLMFPIVAYRAIYPSGRSSIGAWFKEFASNLFMQSGHAVAYAVLIAFFVASQNIFLLLAMFWSLNSIAGIVRNLLGAEGGGEGAGGAMAGMMGLTALMGVKSLFSAVNTDAATSHMKTLGEKAGTVVPGARGGLGAASAGGAGALAGSTAGGSAGAPLMFDSGLRKATKFKSGLTKAAIGVGLAAGAMGMGAALGPAGVAAGVKIGSSAGRFVGKVGGGIATAIGSASDTKHEIALKAEEEGISFREAALNHYGYMHKDQLKDPGSAAQLGHDIGATFGWVPAVVGQHGAGLASKIYGLATGDTAAGKYGDAMRTHYEDEYISSARHDKNVADWAAEQKSDINARLAKYGPGSSSWMGLSQNTASAKNRLDSLKQEHAALQKRRGELANTKYSKPALEELEQKRKAAYNSILNTVRSRERPTKEQNEAVSQASRAYRDMFEARPEGMHILQKRIDSTFAGMQGAEREYNAAREAERAGPAEYAKAKEELSVVEATVAQSKAALLNAQQKHQRRNELIGSQFRDINRGGIPPGGFDSPLVGDFVVR